MVLTILGAILLCIGILALCMLLASQFNFMSEFFDVVFTYLFKPVEFFFEHLAWFVGYGCAGLLIWLGYFLLNFRR
jgi:hypothetical protein